MISFIIPTIGRDSLRATLASIKCAPGDEILVIGSIRPTGDLRPRYFPRPLGMDWGRSERLVGIEAAHNPYLAFIDDDDVYVPNARDLMWHAILTAPNVPTVFKMQYPNGARLWKDPVLRMGNVGTPMVLLPNDPVRLGKWTSRREGDFDFFASSKWRPEQFVWRSEVIALIGHNDGIES